SAGRISIVIDEYQASLVGQCGEQFGDGSGFQHIGVDANSGLRTKLLRERGALVATDKHFPVDEQLYAVGILQIYKTPARVAQQRIAPAQPLRHRSRSKRLSWPIALVWVFASARIAAEPAAKAVGIEQLFHGTALPVRQCRRRRLAGMCGGRRG